MRLTRQRRAAGRLTPGAALLLVVGMAGGGGGGGVQSTVATIDTNIYGLMRSIGQHWREP